MRRRLARRLHRWANWLDPPQAVPLPPIGFSDAIVERIPQSEIHVVHTTIGTQANRSRKYNEKNAWKNRR